jgi:peroxiredoxin
MKATPRTSAAEGRANEARRNPADHGGGGRGDERPFREGVGRSRTQNEGIAGALQPGTRAPNFELNATPDQKVDLNHFKGRPVVLVFYPADWSPVCGDQLSLYNEILPEFNRFGAQLLGISVDQTWCHNAYQSARKLHFPLLADFHPKGAVAQQYGVYRENDGVCERALFVIDRDGVVRWSYVSPLGVNPGADGILNALEQLESKEPKQSQAQPKEFAHA